MTGFHLATWNIQIFSVDSEPAEEGSAYRWSESDARVLSNLPAMLEAVEEDLTSLLPEGYRAKITEWSDPQ